MSESIFVNLSPKINYACHQNDIAVLKELKILNTKDIVWEEVKITMKSSLNFIKPKTWQIKNMNPGEEISIKDITYIFEKINDFAEDSTKSDLIKKSNREKVFELFIEEAKKGRYETVQELILNYEEFVLDVS